MSSRAIVLRVNLSHSGNSVTGGYELVVMVVYERLSLAIQLSNLCPGVSAESNARKRCTYLSTVHFLA